MKRSSLTFVALALAAILAGCTGQGTIRAAAMEPVMSPIVSEHANYIENDATLSPLQKETRQRSLQLLRDAFKAAGSPLK